MADSAYEGVCYSFDSKAEFDALTQKIKARLVADDSGCELWPGDMTGGCPRYVHRHKAAVYQLRRLMHQAANPDFVIPEVAYKIVSSCGNPRCLSANHLTTTTRQAWDVDAISDRIVAGCTRGAVPKGLEVGCLLWTGCTAEGYGMFGVDGATRRVHAVALLIHEGKTEPPLGNNGKPLIARHKCSVRHCCEVSHLEWGTPKQNGEDRVRDGTSGSGEDSPSAKMSNETALAVKQSWRPKGHPEHMKLAERAEKFGVTVGMVTTIDRGIAWKHLPGPINKPVIRRNTLGTPADLSEEDIRILLLSRVNAKVTITENMSKDAALTTPCHIFKGASNKGYGVVRYKNLELRAHVVVCEHKMKAKVPTGLVVRHLCGQKACCNPDHLTFGTKSENGVDSLLHGDVKRKFAADDIGQIREVDVNDYLAVKKAAEHSGTTLSYIRRIIRRQVWAFLE